VSAPTAAKPPIYGYIVEFDAAENLLATAKASRTEGYTVVEAYSPMPLHGLSEILGWKNHMPLIVFCGGLFGAIASFALQYWVAVIEYPLDIGGKPFNSWPAFIVPTFEGTILCAALSAIFGMLWLNGLPQPYHPVFNVPRFVEASRDRFFLMILSRDPKFDMIETKRFLARQRPLSLEEVPH
jgi:hypothetical protein